MPPAFASDNLPMAVTLSLRSEKNERAKKVFFPTPHRLNAEAVQAAVLQYQSQLLRLAANLRTFGSKVAFDVKDDELRALIRKPCVLKVRPNPQRHTSVWSATADSLEAWRSPN